MALTERHRWCMGKVLETYGSELDKEVLEGFVRQEAVLQKFSSFFRGETSGRLFVFYQPEAAEGEVRLVSFREERLYFGLHFLTRTVFSLSRHHSHRPGATRSARSSYPSPMETMGS